jgi:hypothetical protein
LSASDGLIGLNLAVTGKVFLQVAFKRVEGPRGLIKPRVQRAFAVLPNNSKQGLLSS